MSVREYVGARYVPIVVGEWDNSKTYEPLMVVIHEGNSYVSRQYVPTGIDIQNEQYWIESANYNAQVDAYRKEVQAFDGRIAANASNIAAETTRAKGAEQTLQTTLDGNIAAETTRAKGAEQALQTTLDGIAPFDSAPTEGSIKGVTSGGVYLANAGQNSLIADLRKFNYTDTSKVALIFGDSIARGFGTSSPGSTGWANLLANRLGITAYNFAVDGASFSANIKDEVLTAHNSALFDDANVGYIFVSGGINDHGKSYENINTGLTGFFSNIASYYPTAQVIFLPLLCANKPLDSIDQGDQQYLHSMSGMYLLNICHTTAWANTMVISDGYTWLQGFDTAAADQVHPNDVGARIIANNVYSLLRFGYLPPKLIVGTIAWDTGISSKIIEASSYNFYSLNNSMYSIEGKIQFSTVEGIKVADKLMNLPKFAWGRQNQIKVVECTSRENSSFLLYVNNSEARFWTTPKLTNIDYYFRLIGMTGI